MGLDMQLRYHVTVPEGVPPGTTIHTMCDGLLCAMQVPRGAREGDTIACAPGWWPSALRPASGRSAR